MSPCVKNSLLSSACLLRNCETSLTSQSRTSSRSLSRAFLSRTDWLESSFIRLPLSERGRDEFLGKQVSIAPSILQPLGKRRNEWRGAVYEALDEKVFGGLAQPETRD